MKLLATHIKTGERFEVTDLFFFEEEGIHDFNGDGFYEKYTFEFIVEMNDKIKEIHPANDFWYTIDK